MARPWGEGGGSRCRVRRPLPRLADGAEPDPVHDDEVDHTLVQDVHGKAGPIHRGGTAEVEMNTRRRAYEGPVGHRYDI